MAKIYSKLRSGQAWPNGVHRIGYISKKMHITDSWLMLNIVGCKVKKTTVKKGGFK